MSRKKPKMTQQELPEKVGTTVSYISETEKQYFLSKVEFWA